MSVSTTKRKESFSANGVLDTFSFTNLTYFEGEGSTVLKVYLDGVLQGSGYSITEGAATNRRVTSGDVVFTSAPANGVTVLVKRETPITQALDPATTYSENVLEDLVDKLTLIAQENADDIATNEADIDTLEGGGGSTSDLVLPDWAASTAYVVNQVVYYAGDGLLYRCVTAHTSDTAFLDDLNANKWVALRVFEFNEFSQWKVLLNKDTEIEGRLDDIENPVTFLPVLGIDPYNEQSSVAIANSQTNTNITGFTIDADDFDSALFLVDITRSTTIKAMWLVYLSYKNGAWVLDVLAKSDDNTGIDLSVADAGGNVGQVRYTSGAEGTGTFKFKRVKFNA
jgi:hypothetical protein